MKTVSIDAADIGDKASFHAVFAKALGFPPSYGRNMDAWIDCMSSVDDPASHMTSVVVERGETLVISVANASDLKERLPELWEEFLEASAFVNWRRMENGDPAVLAVSADA